MQPRLPSDRELYPKREFHKEGVDGPAYCRQCHAVHENKHWSFNEMAYQKMRDNAKAESVICPGCHDVQIKKVDGILTCRSPQMHKIKDELINLIYRETDRERIKNPLGRIVALESHADEIEVQTTTQFLATRLGHAIDDAFKGHLDIDKLPREAFVRVRWCQK